MLLEQERQEMVKMVGPQGMVSTIGGMLTLFFFYHETIFPDIGIKMLPLWVPFRYGSSCTAASWCQYAAISEAENPASSW